MLLAVMQSQVMGQDFTVLNLAEGEGEVQTPQAMLISLAAARYLAAVAEQAEVVAAMMEGRAAPGVVTFRQLAAQWEAEAQAVQASHEITAVVTAADLEVTPRMEEMEASPEVAEVVAVEL